MRISEASHRWLRDPVNGFSPTTVSGYRYRVQTLIDLVGDKDITDVTEDDLVAGIVAGAVSPGAQRARMVAYRSLFSWLSYKGHVESNPAEHLQRVVKLSSRTVKEHTWLSVDEVRSFLSCLPVSTPVERRNKVLFQLGFTTGLRRNEMAQLTWGKVDLPGSRARVLGKGGKLAAVYLYPSTVEVLTEWRDEGPGVGYVLPRIKHVTNFDGEERFYTILWDHGLTGPWISNTVKRVSEEIGQPLSTHDLRRSYAGMVQEQVRDITQVQAALRHSNVGTTQRYLESRQDAALLAGREAALGF